MYQTKESINEALRASYIKKWPELIHQASMRGVKAAQPLLIKVDDRYATADFKVMIVGQETDGWHGDLGLSVDENGEVKGVDFLMSAFDNYVNKRTKNGANRGKRAFWNLKNFAYFEKHVRAPVDLGTTAHIWNNISKIGGLKGGRPNKQIRDLEKDCFDVFADEIKILNPSLIVFTTGSRDGLIKRHCGTDTFFKPCLYNESGTAIHDTLNLLAELTLESFPHIAAIRVEHPNRRSLNNSIILDTIKRIWPPMIEK